MLTLESNDRKAIRENVTQFINVPNLEFISSKKTNRADFFPRKRDEKMFAFEFEKNVSPYLRPIFMFHSIREVLKITKEFNMACVHLVVQFLYFSKPRVITSPPIIQVCKVREMRRRTFKILPSLES